MANHKWNIEIPIYDYTLIVYTGKSVKSAVNHYKLENYLGEATVQSVNEDGVDGLAFSTKTELSMVIPLDAAASVIAHETTHIINYIFEEIGYITRPDNDEAFTYFLTWLMDEIEARLATKRKAPVARKKKNKPSKQKVFRKR